MLSRIEKKKIIEKISSWFDSYDEMSVFCDKLDNDPEQVERMISKVIKYGFVKSSVFENQSLFAVLHHLDEVDDEYLEFLKSNKRKGFVSFFDKKMSKKEIEAEKKRLSRYNYELDEDIPIEDIEGIRLPTRGFISSICRDNVDSRKFKAERGRQKEEYYRTQRHFDEVAFTYSRTENLKIDPKTFIYYNIWLLGEVYEDYRLLYNDERYGNNNFRTSPLQRSFEDNLAEIRIKNDIQLRKYGNVYEIENGRHRLLYLLRAAEIVTIPVHITRRIEDRGFNVTLNALKKDFGVKVYKNNLLDDEPNILVEYNGIAYEVHDISELQRFSDSLRNGKSNDEFNSFRFDISDDGLKKELMQKYKLMIFEKYKKEGESVLTGNFTEAIKEYEGANPRLFFEAYVMMQSEYQTAKIFKYSFENSVRNSFNIRKDDSSIEVVEPK